MTTYRTGTLRAAIKALVPYRLHFAIGRTLKRVRYFGFARVCPVCYSSVASFRAHGVNRRPDAICPICEARDRHRLAWLFMRTRTDLFWGPHRMLHVSPEPEMMRRLAEHAAIEYVSVDIVPSGRVCADIAALPFPTGSFDIAYCSHVLNMVSDDAPAMAELVRILQPGGWALIQVPIRGAATTEFAGSSSSRQRAAAFGDADIRRAYGADIESRLHAAGFSVSVEPYVTTFTTEERLRYGLHEEVLLVCSKPLDR